jgi:hypothetical protein
VVAQASQPAVSQVSKPARAKVFHAQKNVTLSRLGSRRYSRLRNLRYDSLITPQVFEIAFAHNMLSISILKLRATGY